MTEQERAQDADDTWAEMVNRQERERAQLDIRHFEELAAAHEREGGPAAGKLWRLKADGARRTFARFGGRPTMGPKRPSRISGTYAAALIRLVEAADRAGHDVPAHVGQDLVDVVAEEIAAALQGRIPANGTDVAAAMVQGAWRDATQVALGFVGGKPTVMDADVDQAEQETDSPTEPLRVNVPGQLDMLNPDPDSCGLTDEDAQLWAVHIQGPDDIVAANNRKEAEQVAAEINAARDSIRARHDDSHPVPRFVAKVVPWPYTAEQHAEDLARGDARWDW